MEKKLFLFVFAIVASTSISHSQKVQTYQGTQAFNSMIGAISGTEKYSYYVDDKGNKYRQGTYSFSGNKDFSNNNSQIKGTYTLNTSFAKGKLNGTYTVSGSFSGKTWTYITGWKSFTGTSKLTGVFANGKPNGTFTAFYDGEMEFSGNATMKNGKFVGAYKYSGPGESGSLWKMSGQLTADGKLTGKWNVEDIVADIHNSYTFLNDVLIADGRMTPQLQNIAKQYAEGKINEDALQKKGYIIETESLPIEHFINYLLFVNDDEYGLEKLGGWDFRDFSPKQYKYLKKVNCITNEGFELIYDAYRETQGDERSYTDKNNNELSCSYPYYTNRVSNHITCKRAFALKYGMQPDMVDVSNWEHELYFSSSQTKRFNNLIEQVAISKCKEEIIPGLTKYKKDKKNAANTITYREAISGNNMSITEEERQSYKELDKSLNKECKENGYAYSYRFSSDSSYLFKIHSSGSEVSAINVDVNGVDEYYSWLNQQYEQANSCNQERANIRKRIGDPRSYSRYTFDYAKADIIEAYLSNHTPNNYGKDVLLSEYINIVKSITKVLDICDSLDIKKEMLKEGLQKKSYAAYQKQEKEYTNCYTRDGSTISYETFTNNINELEAIQNAYLAYVNQSKNAQSIDMAIKEKCGKTYSDILKPWSAKYQTCTTLTNDLNSSLTNVKDVQLIGQKLLNYIDSRQHCDKEYTVILNMCGKQYGDVAKPYQAKVKGMTFVPDMTNAETLEKDIAKLAEYSSYQDEIKRYLQNRQKVEQLNQSITEKISSAKNVKKLYGVFYKSLPIVWSVDGDNFKTIKETIFVLQKVEANLQSNGAESYDVQLKKAKTADDFKKVLNL